MLLTALYEQVELILCRIEFSYLTLHSIFSISCCPMEKTIADPSSGVFVLLLHMLQYV